MIAKYLLRVRSYCVPLKVLSCHCMELCYILPSPPPSSRGSDYESACPPGLLQCWFTQAGWMKSQCASPSSSGSGLPRSTPAISLDPHTEGWEERGDGRGTKAKNDRKAEGYQIWSSQKQLSKSSQIPESRTREREPKLQSGNKWIKKEKYQKEEDPELLPRICKDYTESFLSLFFSANTLLQYEGLRSNGQITYSDILHR